MQRPPDQQRLDARERPARSPVLHQNWRHLLFLHWSWGPKTVQASLPPGLYVDTFDGKAWLAIVPLFMRRVRPPFCPAIPRLSDFLELNVRTYVHDGNGVPGVWFYSLDANQRLAVKLARALFHLNYVHAKMRATVESGTGRVRFASRRFVPLDAPETAFEYQPASNSFEAQPGSLEFFLVERYELFSFASRARRLFRGRVWHPPYRIRHAKVFQYDAHMLELNGFTLPDRPPDHVLFSDGPHVLTYALQTV